MPDDFKQLKTQMYEAINRGKTADFVGRLAVIAQSGRIRESFRTDQRYIEFWKKHLRNHWEDLRKLMNDDRQRTTLKDIEAEFIKDPAAPDRIALFFREVLMKKMNLSEEESAMIGVYLSNIARSAGEEEYGKMAYGDLIDGKFKWNILQSTKFQIKKHQINSNNQYEKRQTL